MKRLLTVQDLSCLGKCSITVALPVISALGVECAVLPTAVLSTHTGGFGAPAVYDLTPGLAAIPAHWKSQGVRFDGIYSGYLSDVAQIDAVLALLRELQAEGAPAIVDPAMADHGRLYSGFDGSFAAAMRCLVAAADLALPNLTEAALLTGTPYREDGDVETVWPLLEAVSELGPKQVVVTGVTNREKPEMIGAAFYDAETGQKGALYARRLPGCFHGTGDLFAAVVSALIVKGTSLEETVGRAVEFTAACIAATPDDADERYGVHFEPLLGELAAGEQRKGEIE